ncbi:hypothetical protein BS47DRAFT_1370811 [Hydnum rufescens UP504]|uniref:Chloride channel protein n=1 Tax=Hydnum rufescens UP504 TaxID=1448309 RepID=A0A9P6BAE1_9AGAM|nr:hypothetical protein BS47DRAFT_1370811 [Hydnum rufescens UP504]
MPDPAGAEGVPETDLSTSPASTIRWTHRHTLTVDARGNQSHNSNNARLPLNTSAKNTPQYGSTTASSYAPRRYSTPVIGYQPTSPPSRPSSPRDSRLRSSASAFFHHSKDQSHQNYINGIRFWYSTFTSIDWLHDAVKDSARVSLLRRRRSLRGRLVNLWDRSLGWIVVTIVGFLTAISAFVIVRLEQWLFDIKEGFCNDGWWKAKRFCCPVLDDDLSGNGYANVTRLPFSVTGLNPGHSDISCTEWITWAEQFGQHIKDPNKLSPKTWIIEYIVYSFFALLFVFISAILTIHLTASTSFSARSDSGIPELKCILGGAHFGCGHQIPHLERNSLGFVMRGYLGGRTLAIKAIGLPLSVASGLSLGKEGPFVHIASCWGNIVSRWFRKYETNEAKRREILSAACAAGVAVAFGAPVGGVLFSLEEVSYFFPAKVMWRSFFCAMIAAVTLRLLDPFGTGKLVLFQVTYDKDWHAYELIFFLILGLFGGIFGGYFTKFYVLWVRHVRSSQWMQRHPVSEVMLVAVLTTTLGFLNPYTRMGGTELVYNLFAECQPGGGSHEGLCVEKFAPIFPVITAIAAAMFIKGALTVITFGTKVPAGIFIPSLGVGACFGRIVGLLIQYLQWYHPKHPMFDVCRSMGDNDCVIPGLYAMVGAAAALSGVTRTTISLAVIVFELTRTMTYVVPVMLSILVAKTVADFIHPQGLYDSHEHLWGSHTVQELINRKVDVIRADVDNTAQSLTSRLHKDEGGDGGFPIVIMEDGLFKVTGYISDNELEHALTIVADNPTALCHFDGQYPIQEPSSSISSIYDYPHGRDLHQMFTKVGARYIILTNPDGYLEGVLDKKTWIGFVNELSSA